MSEKEHHPWSDIYISYLKDDGTYTRPVVIPGSINTTRDEATPFLAPDDKTLYYSSNRKDMGLGGSDIYYVKRLDDSWKKWSEPVNVGRPVNTSAFDAYLSVDNKNNVFTSMAGDPRDGGNLDIFQLVPKKINITMKGLVLDQESNRALPAEMIILNHDTIESTSIAGYTYKVPAEGEFAFRIESAGYDAVTYDVIVPEVYNDTTIIRDFMLLPERRPTTLAGKIFDSKTNNAVTASFSIVFTEKELQKNEAEEYDQELKEEGWYYILASAEGYLNTSDSIYFEGQDSQIIEKNIYMDPIEVGTTVRIKNIYFDFDKTTLKPISFVELDKVVDLLQKNPTLEIEIAGHTDSKGSDDYNLNLSQGRAQAVVDYLISQGIEDYRLVARGYGETVPVATNDTDEGRAENRRVEFTVLSN